jgi:hypothetical protein
MHDKLPNFLIPVHSNVIMVFFHRDENGITSSPTANLSNYLVPAEVYKNPVTLSKGLVLTLWESPLSFGLPLGWQCGKAPRLPPIDFS